MVETDPEQEHDEAIELAKKLLPAWFVPRMMSDPCYFGILLVTGQVLAAQGIDSVCQAANGDVWIDVMLCDHEPCDSETIWDSFGETSVISTSQSSASLNASHIVLVIELV